MGKTPFRLLPDFDLSEMQIFVTIQTFDRYADVYAEKWEWNPSTIKEIEKYNIKPFLKYVKKEEKILVVECQSGRDYSILSEHGLRCLGTGISYGLLSEAIKRVPTGFFVHLDPRSLPFIPESYEAIYADALTSIPRRDLSSVLSDFRIFLKSEGVLYLSLRLGRKNVFLIEDLGGKRYLTLYRKQEILDILNKVGFKILWSAISIPTDPVLPKWFSLIAQRK